MTLTDRPALLRVIREGLTEFYGRQIENLERLTLDDLVAGQDFCLIRVRPFLGTPGLIDYLMDRRLAPSEESMFREFVKKDTALVSSQEGEGRMACDADVHVAMSPLRTSILAGDATLRDEIIDVIADEAMRIGEAFDQRKGCMSTKFFLEFYQRFLTAEHGINWGALVAASATGHVGQGQTEKPLEACPC